MNKQEELSAYDKLCKIFNDMKKQSLAGQLCNVTTEDIGRPVMFLASDGTMRKGILDCYDSENDVCCVTRNLLGRYRVLSMRTNAVPGVDWKGNRQT